MEAALSDEFLGPVTVTWDQPEAADVQIQYQVNGRWLSSPVRSVRAGEQSMTIVGIPLGETASWRVFIDHPREPVLVEAPEPIVSAPLPKSFPPLKIDIEDDLRRDDYILTSVNERNCGWCSGPYWTFITNREGQVVWATRTGTGEWTLFSQVSVRGDHIIYDVLSEPSFAVRTYLDESIEEIGMAGHHHGFIELPDGTLAWGEHQSGAFTEQIVERAPGSDETRTVWSCSDWPQVQGCRSNALEYDAERDVYWFSFYTLNAVAEVDRSTGDLVGFSDLRRPGPQIANEYVFSPENSIFTWQHGPRVLPNGNMLISTDDTSRTTTKISEYELDRDSGVFTEVWSYDPGVLARFNGDVLRLENGNSMHGLGAAGIAYEVNDEGQEVWRMSFPDGHQVGRLAVIEDLYTLVAP